MASGGLLALLDDLASILDDVAAMAKIAVKKTAGVAGDDLAVGANQVVGLSPDRELPIVWAVAKGSFWNKCWLVPSALLLSAFAPMVIMPIMMLGGAFLCYEGVHKLVDKLKKRGDDPHRAELTAAALQGPESLLELERGKIKEAIQTDMILSAEIVVIALGAMSDAAFWTRAVTLTAVAVIMTIAIYGLIALIVKADDVGLHLSKRAGAGTLAATQRALGRGLLAGMPPFMKLLSIVGTIAMFLVGGGIVVHGIPGLEPALLNMAHGVGSIGFISGVIEQALVLGVGVVIGVVALPIASLIIKVTAKGSAAGHK
ncbi:MAG: DUF808 domain-containing protein [Myxococcales bacterium]|nr:DUF808 domain-containing protein [Myxococcales bacterium]